VIAIIPLVIALSRAAAAPLRGSVVHGVLRHRPEQTDWPMHIVMVIVAGLIGLAVFWFGFRMFGRPGAAGAGLFIWVWFAAALLNGAVGVFKAGIPPINEVAAFIPIFGIPAAIAWYLAYRLG
jgi:hypothetical protein